METSHRSLRVTLLFLFAADLSLAYLYLLDPETLSRLFGGAVLDSTHLSFALSLGAMLAVLSVAGFLAFLQPAKNAPLILVLILSHFALFLADMASLARGQLPLLSVLPQMAYDLVVATLLIRFYPARQPRKSRAEAPAQAKNPLDALASPPAPGAGAKKAG